MLLGSVLKVGEVSTGHQSSELTGLLKSGLYTGTKERREEEFWHGGGIIFEVMWPINNLSRISTTVCIVSYIHLEHVT